MRKSKREKRIRDSEDVYVYFIREGHDHLSEGEFKIGFSVNPEERMRNLQTGNPRPLVLHSKIACPGKQFAKQLEGSLHQYFLPKPHNGEWFRVTVEDIARVESAIAHMLGNELPPYLFSEIMETFFGKYTPTNELVRP
jgi:hypothetical protein